MLDAVEDNSNSWMNGGYGFIADVNMPGLPRFTPIPRDVYHIAATSGGSSLCHAKTRRRCRHVSREDGIAALTALGISGNTINDSRTITISNFLEVRRRRMSEAQVLTTDQIRDPWVHSFAQLCVPIEG